MNTATWIIATHFRPKLLWVALLSIRDQVYPAGWDFEIVVSHHADDREAPKIVAEMTGPGAPVRAVWSSHPTGGGKRTAALKVATGELVLVADDDDHQHSDRAKHAISAFERGCWISELKEFRYLHTATGDVVRWCGRGDLQRPAVLVGTARNYRRSLLMRVGGWKALPRLIEKDLQSRLKAKMPKSTKVFDLGTELSSGTVCLQHGTNIWGDRPIIPKGQISDRGAFRLHGEGHWKDLPDFPAALVQRLQLA